MNKKLLVLLILFSLTLAGCQKVEKEENDDNNDNGAISVQPIDKGIMSDDATENSNLAKEEDTEEPKIDPKPIVIAPKPQIDPTLCEIDMDCVAIPHPANGCYKAYFNKNATEAIDEYRNREGMMVQDCPEFGDPVCINNKCTDNK